MIRDVNRMGISELGAAASWLQAAGGGGDGGGPSRTGLVLEPLLEIKAAPPRGATGRPRGEDFRCALDLGNVPNSLHALLSGNTRAC